MDDILIYGTCIEEHDMKSQETLSPCQGSRTLNRQKCKIRVNQVAYVGHLLTSKGIKPDTKRIEATVSIPNLEDIPALKRFLGMATYCAKFIPNLRSEANPLRELPKKNTECNWLEQQKVAFKRVKN